MKKPAPKTPKKSKAAPAKPAGRPVLLVTGMSGAGHSSALKILEDIGYKAIDNLPISLLEPLLAEQAGQHSPVAIGVDSRGWDFSAQALAESVTRLRGMKGLALKLLYMDCQTDVLQQRFTETRRIHPLAVDRPVGDGIAQERAALLPLRDAVDHVIDTSHLRPQDLKRILSGYFRLDKDLGLAVFITSFGFRNGLPREADLVFDVRFLDNPHWDPALRPLSGLDKPVADKVRRDTAYKPFFKNLTALIAPLLPRYLREGRHYLTIAIGCTGGRHRSVFTAEQLGAWFTRAGFSAEVRHRDLAGWTARQGLNAAERQGLDMKAKTGSARKVRTDKVRKTKTDKVRTKTTSKKRKTA
ncbi:MAG: RNase adapter RapZ [Alphaproteobacteria bacterium]|nr:RNase adapter RapZ [Alphaproteobacteria bacterium]